MDKVNEIERDKKRKEGMQTFLLGILLLVLYYAFKKYSSGTELKDPPPPPVDVTKDEENKDKIIKVYDNTYFIFFSNYKDSIPSTLGIKKFFPDYISDLFGSLSYVKKIPRSVVSDKRPTADLYPGTPPHLPKSVRDTTLGFVEYNYEYNFADIANVQIFTIDHLNELYYNYTYYPVTNLGKGIKEEALDKLGFYISFDERSWMYFFNFLYMGVVPNSEYVNYRFFTVRDNAKAGEKTKDAIYSRACFRFKAYWVGNSVSFYILDGNKKNMNKHEDFYYLIFFRAYLFPTKQYAESFYKMVLPYQQYLYMS